MHANLLTWAAALALLTPLTSAAALPDLDQRAVSCPTGAPSAAVKIMKSIPGPATTFCRNFLKPSTVTNTITPTSTAATVTITVAAHKRSAAPELQDRAIAPLALLAYATPILSSACSCLGVTASTTTKTITAAPTLLTLTVTATASPTPTPTPTCSLSSGSVCGSGIDGYAVGASCGAACCNYTGYYNCGPNLDDNIYCCNY